MDRREQLALDKRSQLERLTIAFDLLDKVWSEMADGKVEAGLELLQLAVYIQTDANRIVWLLNKLRDAEEEAP